jgi:hypothetical protein
MTRALAALWAAIAFALLAETIVVQYIGGGIGAPFLDEWRYLDPTQYLADLFERHNRHPFAIGRLFLAADYYLANASGDLTRALVLLSALINVCAIGALAWAAGLRNVATLFAVVGLAAVAVFNPFGRISFLWGFQATFLLVFALAPVCFLLVDLYAQTRPNSIRALRCRRSIGNADNGGWGGCPGAYGSDGVQSIAQQ